MPITQSELLAMSFDDTLIGAAIAGRIDGTAANELILIGPLGRRVDAGDGNDGIIGGDGNDVIVAGRGNDTVFGGGGDDVIHGNKGFNQLSGGDGNDTITSGDQASILMGDAGNDTLIARLKLAGAHTLTGGEGQDVFRIELPSEQWNVLVTITDFDATEDRLFVFGREDRAFFNSGVEIQNGPGGVRVGIGPREALELNGQSIATLRQSFAFDGNDSMIGSDGFDRLSGGNGHDQIFGNGGADIIDGGSGRDQVFGGDGMDTIAAGLGNDTVYGGAGHDVIHGQKGNNVLHGDAGNDYITSGDQSSLLYGGDDHDRLVARMKKGATHILDGGKGTDTFEIIQTGVSQRPGQVVIADFETGIDKVRIEGLLLADYLDTTPAANIADTPWGVWLTLQGGEIIKFNDLTLAELSPWL